MTLRKLPSVANFEGLLEVDPRFETFSACHSFLDNHLDGHVSLFYLQNFLIASR